MLRLDKQIKQDSEPEDYSEYQKTGKEKDIGTEKQTSDIGILQRYFIETNSDKEDYAEYKRDYVEKPKPEQVQVETAQPLPPQNPPKKKLPSWAIGIIVAVSVLYIASAVMSISSVVKIAKHLMEDLRQEQLITYEEIQYVRPDTKAIIDRVEEITLNIEKNKIAYEEQLELIKEYYNLYEELYTGISLAEIELAVSYSEKNYNEVVLLTEAAATFEEKAADLYIACGKSPHMKAFETDIFGKGFLKAYQNTVSPDPELEQLLEKEAELIAAYSAVYSYDENGVISLIHSILESNGHTNDGSNAYGEMFCLASLELFGDIIIELINVRNQIARCYGYSDYMQYILNDIYGETSWTEACEYLEDMVENTRAIYRSNLVMINGIPGVTSGNVDFQQIMDMFEQTMESFPEEFQQIHQDIAKRNMYNLGEGQGSSRGLMVKYLYQYDTPFIYCCFENTLSDYLNLSYAQGIATAYQLNGGQALGNMYLETCGLAMQLLMIEKMKDEHDMDQSKLKGLTLFDFFLSYYQGAFLLDFEMNLYRLAEVTPENISWLYSETAKEYGVSFDFTGVKGSEDYQWIFIPDYILYPGAYYESCITYDLAMFFYKTEKEEPGEGVKLLMRFMDLSDGSMSLDGKIKELGIKNPKNGNLQKSTAELVQQECFSVRVIARN